MEATTVIDTVLLKVASRCNLDCGYCYVYSMGDTGWRDQPARMPVAVVDAIVEQLARLSFAQTAPLSVVMHGGEPLLLGLDRITRLVGGLRRELRPGCGLHLQTNGILLAEPFIDLFVHHDVGISISFDGPLEVHDSWRVDRRGRGSHARVSDGIDRLRRHPGGARIFQGVLAVIDPKSDPETIYRSLKATGAPGFDLLYRDGNRSKLPPGKAALDSEEYGRWMASLLDHYLCDPSPPRIRVLDDMLRLLLGAPGQKEGVGLTDFGIFVVETDGSVSKNDTLKVATGGADRFVSRWSVLQDDLVEVVRSPEFRDYHRQQMPRCATCVACPDLAVCGGGMTAHRWSASRGFDNPSVFCADQRYLIGHMRRHLATARAAA